MANIDKDKLKVISEKDSVDLSKASMNKKLSAVDYNDGEKYFYVTIDKVLFSNPVTTIKKVLDAHGYVTNLENILSCLDSLTYAIHARPAGKGNDGPPYKINDYMPCVRFEMPQKNRVGETLQSFYNEIARYEAKLTDQQTPTWSPDPEMKKAKDLKAQVKALEAENRELREQVSALTLQLSKEQKSLSRASRALDSQRVLPDNAKICRVEDVDLKRRMVKIKCYRKVIDIPTHMLDSVPNFQARCLLTFEEDEDTPIGIIFFDREELGNLEKRTAELLYVEGDTFKARDSLRNEFQIKALNDMEASTIKSLKRGMKVVISIADGYVVRFAILGSASPQQFTSKIQEQYIVYDIARNQLVTTRTSDDE